MSRRDLVCAGLQEGCLVPIRGHGGLAMPARLPFQGDILQEGLGGLWSRQKAVCSGHPLQLAAAWSPRTDRVHTCCRDRRPDPCSWASSWLWPLSRPPCPPPARPLPGPPPECHLWRPTTPIPRVLKALSFCLISLHAGIREQDEGAPAAGAE